PGPSPWPGPGGGRTASSCPAGWPRGPSHADHRTWPRVGRPERGGRPGPPPRRSPSRFVRSGEPRRAGGCPSSLCPQRAYARAVDLRTTAIALLQGALTRHDGAAAEEIVSQLSFPSRVVSADPLEDHGGMLLLLVPVMTQDGAKLVVLGGIHPLLVPVHRFQLFHEAHDRSMHVAGGWFQVVFGLVEGRRTLGHGQHLASLVGLHPPSLQAPASPRMFSPRPLRYGAWSPRRGRSNDRSRGSRSRARAPPCRPRRHSPPRSAPGRS